MRKLIAAVAAVGLLATTTPAMAGGGYTGHGHKSHGNLYGHWYGHGGHRNHHFKGKHWRGDHGRHAVRKHDRHRRHFGVYHHRKDRHDDRATYLLGGLAGGVVLGHLLTRPTYPAPVATYSAPLVQRDCVATTGVGYLGARPAEFVGTMCYDAYGRGYIVAGSERFNRYLD